MSRKCWQVSCECIIFFHFFRCQHECTSRIFFECQHECRGKKSNMTTIATWRGKVRQTHSHRHFGYSKHGQWTSKQGHGAVGLMDGNRDKRGNQWVGIGYTTSYRCTKDWLVGLGIRERKRKGRQRDSMKMEGANTVYKRLVVASKEHRK